MQTSISLMIRVIDLIEVGLKKILDNRNILVGSARVFQNGEQQMPIEREILII